MRKILRLVPLGILVLILAACSSQPGPPGTGSQDDEEVLIPPTTEVLSDEARASLTNVDDEWTLTFEFSQELLDSMEVDDVLVSEPTEAAPHGLLRKVSAVRQEGDLLTVETEGAEIRDAIHQGSLDVTIELEPEDLESTTLMQQGIRTLGFQQSIDTDLGTGDRVRVQGSLEIDPIIDLKMGIGCDDKAGPICTEVPDLDVMTRVGVEENASLRISGGDELFAFDEEFPLVTHNFKPITFFIGPVPVVITPQLIVYLSASGSMGASFAFGVTQELTAAAGFRYNSDSGFEDISEIDSNFDRTDSFFNGNIAVRAVAGSRFQLRLYGLIGPFGSLEAGPGFNASQNGIPGSGDLLWNLEGCLWVLVGINSVDVLDINYEKEIFDACTGIDSQSNNDPIVTIQSPNEGSLIYRGVPFTLRGQAFDDDGQSVSCEWTSSRSGDPLPSDECETTVTFSTIGTRTLTLTGTDPAGGNSSESVEVNVQEPPDLLVEITSLEDGQGVGPTSELTLEGTANGGVAPYQYSWSVAHPTDEAGFGGTVHEIGDGNPLDWRPIDTLDYSPSCSAVNDYARLQLEVTDEQGEESSSYLVLHITRLC